MRRGYAWLVPLAAILLMTVAVLSSCSNPHSNRTIVEVFYLPHAPAEEVVNRIRAMVAKRNDVELLKYSFDDPATAALAKSYKIEGHMPVAVFIDGRDTYEVNGKKIVFINFPTDSSFAPTGFTGNWSYADIQKVLNKRSAVTK